MDETVKSASTAWKTVKCMWGDLVLLKTTFNTAFFTFSDSERQLAVMDALKFVALHGKNTMTQWGGELHYIYETHEIFSNTGFTGRMSKRTMSAKKAVGTDVTDIDAWE